MQYLSIVNVGVFKDSKENKAIMMAIEKFEKYSSGSRVSRKSFYKRERLTGEVKAENE